MNNNYSLQHINVLYIDTETINENIKMIQKDRCGNYLKQIDDLNGVHKIMQLCKQYKTDHTIFPLDTSPKRFRTGRGVNLYTEYNRMRGSIKDINQLNNYIDTKDLNINLYKDVSKSITLIGIDPNMWDIVYISVRSDTNIEALGHKDALIEGWPIITIVLQVPKHKLYQFYIHNLQCTNLQRGNFYSILSTDYVEFSHRYIIKDKTTSKKQKNDDDDVFRILVGALPKNETLLEKYIKKAKENGYDKWGFPPRLFTGQNLQIRGKSLKENKSDLCTLAVNKRWKKTKEKKKKIYDHMTMMRNIKKAKSAKQQKKKIFQLNK